MKEYKVPCESRNNNHTLEITLQSGEYKGTLRQDIGGNCRGFTVLQVFDPECFDPKDLSYNDCNLAFSNDDDWEDWFTCTLKNEKGEELECEGCAEDLGDMVVKLEIIACEKAE